MRALNRGRSGERLLIEHKLPQVRVTISGSFWSNAPRWWMRQLRCGAVRLNISWPFLRNHHPPPPVTCACFRTVGPPGRHDAGERTGAHRPVPLLLARQQVIPRIAPAVVLRRLLALHRLGQFGDPHLEIIAQARSEHLARRVLRCPLHALDESQREQHVAEIGALQRLLVPARDGVNDDVCL